MGNIAFVASTLPIPLLKNKLKNWEIEEIVLSGKSLEKSFSYLINKSTTKISTTPSGRFNNFLFIFFKLLCISFTKKKVYFFHECCWFNFDLILDFVNVQAEFFPQVSLKSFIKVETEEIHSRYQRYILKLFKISDKFVQFKIIEDNNEGHYYVLSKKVYNNNVKYHTIEESYKLRKSKLDNNNNNNKEILILAGRETVSDLIIANIYEEIIEKLSYLGYNVCVKNHPRVEARLNLNNKKIYKEFEAHIPFELIDDSFVCIIGCASTSLNNQLQPSISIIKFSGMQPDNIKLRIDHLLELPNSDNIIFPESMDDMISIINNLKK
jgi:hypothetical protein